MWLKSDEKWQKAKLYLGRLYYYFMDIFLETYLEWVTGPIFSDNYTMIGDELLKDPFYKLVDLIVFRTDEKLKELFQTLDTTQVHIKMICKCTVDTVVICEREVELQDGVELEPACNEAIAGLQRELIEKIGVYW